MKPDQIVIVIFFLSSLLIGIAAAYFLPRFIATPNPFINQAEIVKFVSSNTGAPDITEEYHLWLKMEISPFTFDALFKSNKNESPKDAPVIKKDEMRSERLVNENVIQDMLVIKGYSQEGITNRVPRLTPECGITKDIRPPLLQSYRVPKNSNQITATNTGLPLRINKVITLAKENIRPLYDSEPLANPQNISRQIFQPQTDIYQTTEGDKTLLYIHLASGIKPKGLSNLLSLTIIYLKDNKVTQSQTLPPFSY